jgi:nucleotide-binding universal stress UspA family protein
MKTTILVPVDFTRVAHNALHYACEISKNNPTEIVAVHLLEKVILDDIKELPSNNLVMKKMMERMYKEIIQKTTNDLTNFVADLKSTYGDIIRTLISHGSIFDAFNEVADSYESSLIVMGTHGITGMQHFAGSNAYKIVSNSPKPIFVVQNRPLSPIETLYFAFKNQSQLACYSELINELCSYFPCNIIFNILSEETVFLPESLEHLAGKTRFISHHFNHENIISSAMKEGADAVGICINELDCLDSNLYGMTQEKILANKFEIPVLCLPER